MRMGAIHIHSVNKLSLNFGWELLCKKVFTDNDVSDMQRMKDIGLQIVEKCDGLPVAIKVIAGVLMTKDRNKREWENVLNSDAWTITGLPEDFRGALYLSYEALPSAIKHCFLYCSLKPHNYALQLEELVPEWIAEGFIKPSGNASMEDVAEDYFMELIRRSFLQPHPEYIDMSVCTMHDLLRGLAQSLAGDESFVGDPQDAQCIDSVKRVRRLTVSSTKESMTIQHLDCLRRLSIWTPPRTLSIWTPRILNTQVIGSLKRLRLLILNSDEIENIPDSIGDLLHLRLLNLGGTRICNLPDSLGNLINLQFLLLHDCKSLHNLPISITKLSNLRQLILENSPLNYVPKGIGSLLHLNYLSGLAIGDDGIEGEGCELEELQVLKNLSYLGIKNLEKARGESVSMFSNKPHLRNLMLSCTPNTGGHIQQQEMDKIVQVFDELSPPPGLVELLIGNYFGAQYPKWMITSSINATLHELTYLHLFDCRNCPQLPQLGQLPQLKYLSIKGATAVVSIGPEFLGNNGEPAKIAFPKLEYLKFRNMTNWKHWSLIREEEDDELESSKPLLFPHLISISIRKCPNLRALPRGLNQASFQELKIEEAHSVLRVSHFPALRKLLVSDCLILEVVEKLESLQRLLMIEEEDESLPEWFISFLQQRETPPDDQFHLDLRCSAQALKGCLKGRPYWVFLQQVPRLEAYAEDGRMYLKYTKEPYSYQTNIHEDATNEG